MTCFAFTIQLPYIIVVFSTIFNAHITGLEKTQRREGDIQRKTYHYSTMSRGIPQGERERYDGIIIPHGKSHAEGNKGEPGYKEASDQVSKRKKTFALEDIAAYQFLGQHFFPGWADQGNSGQDAFVQRSVGQGKSLHSFLHNEHGLYSHINKGLSAINQGTIEENAYGREDIQYGSGGNPYSSGSFRREGDNIDGYETFRLTDFFQGNANQGADSSSYFHRGSLRSELLSPDRLGPRRLKQLDFMQERSPPGASQQFGSGRGLVGISRRVQSNFRQSGFDSQGLLRPSRVPIEAASQSVIQLRREEQPSWLQQNVVQVLAQTGHIDFLQFVQRAGLISVLYFSGVTAFVPHPLVIGNASAALQTSLQDENTLRAFIGYHLYQGFHDSNRIEDGQALMSFDGRSIYVNKLYSHEKKVLRLWIQGAQAISTDVYARNGVVHVLNNILVAPTQTIRSLLQQSFDYKVFSKLLEKHALFFQFPQGVTFFAPLDSAFKNLPEKFVQEAFNDDKRARTLLRNHIIYKPYCRGRLFHQSGWWQGRNSLGEALNFYQDMFNQETSYVNNAAILTEHIAKDGFLFGITQVLIPYIDANVLEVVKQQGCTEFWQLLNSAGYTVSLSNLLLTRTVFAPSNAAIEKLPVEIKQRLRQDQEFLWRVTSYHQLVGRHYAEALEGLRQIKTRLIHRGNKSQQEAPIMNMFGVLSFQGAQVTRENVLAINGIVHVTEQLILPPNETLYDLLKQLPSASRFYKAVNKSGLIELLQAKKPHTILAPTNEAIEDFHQTFGNKSARGGKRLEDLVRRHLLTNSFFKGGMRLHTTYNVETLENVGGKNTSLALEARGQGERQLFFTDYEARTVRSDLPATNGVMFLISKVLYNRDNAQ